MPQSTIRWTWFALSSTLAQLWITETSVTGSNHAAVVEELIRRGASVNAECTDGSTPLGNAVAEGKTNVVATLIQHGAAVSMVTVESL